ncbi:MAG: hypothetical protein H7Z72_10595 [Bacteroidetes bacterium]|nr:hypothetical protein [Fibrella sp.]
MLTLKPKQLFLIDGAGALLTVCFLVGSTLLPKQYLGMPPPILTGLAAIALGFALYSGGCFLFVGTRWRPFLNVISLANLAYCILTAGLVVAYFDELTPLGVMYFSLEIVVICGLVLVERRALANR